MKVLSMASDISIRIAHDRSKVELYAPAGLSPEAVAPRAVAARLQQLGVLVDQPILQKLAEFTAAYAKGEEDYVSIIAEALPPTKGADGRVEWAPGFDPTQAVQTAQAPAEGVVVERTDHYAGRAYIAVAKGTRLGKVIPPQDGTPGRDVRGGAIILRGDPARITFHDSVQCDAAGNITARVDGNLVLDGERLAVSRHLTINGHVDFTTGHINFPGDVSIAGSVRTGFKVTAGEQLTVSGLVEVADIACGKDLKLPTGMAGNHKATLAVGGHAHVGYLEAVSGAVTESLTAEREVVDCNLIIGGDFNAGGATVFGGELAITGSCIIKTLGSEAGKATTLLLADVPLLQLSRKEAIKSIEQIDAKLKVLLEQQRLIKLNPRPTAPEKERLTEFAYEIDELQRERKPKADALAEIERIFKSKRRLDVQVTKAICPGVTLKIGDFTVRFKTMVKGPLTIFWDVNQQLLCRLGSADPRPLNTVAHVMRDTPAQSQQRAA